MAGGLIFKTKWSDNLNLSWANENNSLIADRAAVDILYGRLQSNQEVVIVPSRLSVAYLNGSRFSSTPLPDYAVEPPSIEEQELYLDALLREQLLLARSVCFDTPFAKLLQRRLIVLQRIFHAITQRYHDRNVSDTSHQPLDSETTVAASMIFADGSKSSENACMGSDALIEIAVKTGLNLVFGLMRQNVIMSRQLGLKSSCSVCDDVLRTALEVITSFSPLSLADQRFLPPLALSSLSDVTAFLRSIIVPQSGAEAITKRLAIELLLVLAVQRGSLNYLLDWIEMALGASSTPDLSEEDSPPPRTITHALFVSSVMQIKLSATGSDKACGHQRKLSCNEFGLITLFEAAMYLIEELCSLAINYMNSCTMPDKNQNSSEDSVGRGAHQSSDVYVWGSNSSHQLAEGMLDKVPSPKQSTVFVDVVEMEAGQYCTFVIHKDGSVSACGKGSYGRLGLGSSNNQPLPCRITFEPVSTFRHISSSKGSDGHTLALTTDGRVFSWGDGDYGKLGLGTNTTQKSPKLIVGPLSDKSLWTAIYGGHKSLAAGRKVQIADAFRLVRFIDSKTRSILAKLRGTDVVRCISAGYRHSAAITELGELYTWGEGDHGRLGHGDSNGRSIPTLVKDIGLAGQVACGSSHTLVVSSDGWTVWSFGGGDNGKLGHGDANRVYKPKPIEALSGFQIRKVICGAQFSMALTVAGKVYAWGCGPCIGCGPETIALRPRAVDEFLNVHIVDIACGDSHCLALTADGEVYAWGNNAVGLCGLGHCQSPVCTPKIVTALRDVRIHQISAGTTHSMAWTAAADRITETLHQPFAIDIQEVTFLAIRQFIERYCNSFGSGKPPSPFPSES